MTHLDLSHGLECYNSNLATLMSIRLAKKKTLMSIMIKLFIKTRRRMSDYSVIQDYK